MDENDAKTGTKYENVVQFITENQVKELVGEANASLMLNPMVVWAKFILTDNLPNGNNQRVPTEEFDNLINSGLHMPVKMAEGKIDTGHDNSKPLGVITHLKKDKDQTTNADIIVALAALWAGERPSDVAYIRELMQANEEVNVSWELGYGDSRIAESGVQDLLDTVLKAVTLVTRPAYQGRTRFVSIAAKAEKWGKAYVDMLPDSSFLVIESGGELDATGKTLPRSLRHFPIRDDSGKLDLKRLQEVKSEIQESTIPSNLLENAKAILDGIDISKEVVEDADAEDKTLKTIEELQEEIKSLQDKLEEATKLLNQKNEELDATKASLLTLESDKTAMSQELDSLKEFKTEIEKKEEAEKKLQDIRNKFLESGIEKDDEYFESKKEFLLGLDETALNFMIQELSSFPKLEEGQGEASLKNKPRVPRIDSTSSGELSVEDLVKALKERKAK